MLSDEDKQWIEDVIDGRLDASEKRMNAVFDGRLDASEERMKEFVGKAVREMETSIISEFWKWGRTADARYRQDHSAVLGLDERVQSVEDRITALERRER